MPRRSRLATLVRVAWSVGLVGGSLDGARALPPLTQESRLVLTVEVLLTDDSGGGTSLSKRSLEIAPSKPATAEIPLAWPTAEGPTKLLLKASGAPGPGEEHDIQLIAVLGLPGGKAVRSDRAFHFREGTTSLAEVYREGRRKLILTLQAEQVSRPVLRAGGISAGRPVRFRLEIVRIEGPTSFALESNRMDTFVGEAVEYSFHRGEGDELESVSVSLRPSRLEADVADVEIEVNASLPGAPERTVLSRRDRLLTTRGQNSTFTVTTGEPPSGYRFVVTPDF